MAGDASTTDGDRDPFAALSAAAEACVALDVTGLSDGEVLDAVYALGAVLGRVEACVASVAAAARARSLHRLDRARSIESWLAARTELAHGRAKALVGIGRQLPVCPHVDSAYRGAVLGTAKVELLVAARDQVEDLFAEHEADLVTQITPLSVRQAKVLLAHWRAIALATVGADGGPDPSTDDTRNTLHLSRTLLGRFRLGGDLDAIGGQRLADLLDAERDARFRSGEWTHTDGLSASQRNAIILADLLDDATGDTLTPPAAEPDAGPATAPAAVTPVEFALEPPDETPPAPAAAAPRPLRVRRRRPRPSVTLHWDAQHLLGDAAHAVADALRRRCVLGDHTTLDRLVAERLLCDADVTEILTYFGLDGTTHPLGVTHQRRRPTRAERAAIEARDRSCVFPGCDIPAHRTDAHHTVPYELAKRTALHELVLLCRNHHHAVHEGGYTLTRTPDGHIHLHDPDGHHIPAPGHGHKPPPPPPPEQRPRTTFLTRNPPPRRPPPKPPDNTGLAA